MLREIPRFESKGLEAHLDQQLGLGVDLAIYVPDGQLALRSAEEKGGLGMDAETAAEDPGLEDSAKPWAVAQLGALVHLHMRERVCVFLKTECAG